MMILATNPRISPLLPHTCYLILHVSTGTASYMHHSQTGRQVQRGRFHADGQYNGSHATAPRHRNVAKISEPLRKKEEVSRRGSAILKDANPFPTTWWSGLELVTFLLCFPLWSVGIIITSPTTQGCWEVGRT